MRIAILGNSGSGKSTLAREVAARHGIPVLDLDTIYFEPGRVAVPRDPAVARADLVAFCAQPTWVVEGCYGTLIEAALAFQPTLWFLNPGVAVCEAHCRARPWEPHKYATKAEQDSKLDFLLAWVRDYDRRDGEMSLSGHRALFDRYAGPKHELTEPTSA